MTTVTEKTKAIESPSTEPEPKRVKGNKKRVTYIITITRGPFKTDTYSICSAYLTEWEMRQIKLAHAHALELAYPDENRNEETTMAIAYIMYCTGKITKEKLEKDYKITFPKRQVSWMCKGWTFCCTYGTDEKPYQSVKVRDGPVRTITIFDVVSGIKPSFF